jgi:hypothetical protein
LVFGGHLVVHGGSYDGIGLAVRGSPIVEQLDLGPS